jgi:ATP-dependent DNA helicase DinG
MTRSTTYVGPIGELFAADGALAAAIPGFAERTEQVAMAELVADALARHQRYAIEAGTGIGKTFAYLAPALLAGKRIIVSTGTRTLQDQLFHRDLPVITSAIGRPARVAILKGRANYLCLHRLELAERELALSPRRRNQFRVFDRIRRWALQTRAGDIGELASVSESDPIWQSVTSTRENCLGADCPVFQRCHVVAARREAQAADVVVVNHYLLMADLLLKERGFGDLLPGADAIVIDEAHQLPEVAEHFLGFAVSTRQIQHLCRDVVVELQSQSTASEQISRTIQQLEHVLAASLDVLQTERCESEQWPTDFVEALADIAQWLGALADNLADLSATQPAFAAAKGRADELTQRLKELHGADSDASVDRSVGVRWAQASRQGFSVHFAPIDIARQLGALIDAHSASWIFTSATLAVAGDFTHYLRRIGLSEAHTALFGSPFDYRKQSLLFLPQDLDEPSSSRHTRQVIDAALPILAASGGRAFLLFTSHRALRTGAAYLRDLWGIATPYPLLVQGEAPRDLLLQNFREAGNAVLLGTGSFWEGVDVKGPALAVVVIDKLPFAVPDDPVLKARLAAIEQRGGNPFFEEQVPQAAITLKQGVGRLIRDTQDFGIVMLCDRRVVTKPYGRIILDSLPPMRRTESLSEVTEFLRVNLERAGIAPASSVVKGFEAATL